MPYLGSNTALFRGQAVADLYCSDYWAPAPAFPFIPPGFQSPYVRLRSECIALGYTFFALEATNFGPNVPNVIWNFLPPWVQQNHLNVMTGGHFMFPNQQPIPLVPQFAIASGQVTLGYVLPWHHTASVTHALYAPANNVWHYHSHHKRPSGNHFSITPLDTGAGRTHISFPVINYGVQAQFFRSY